MRWYEILEMLFITAVIAEFGIHVIYHAMTGKAGLYDPPFAYLKDVFSFFIGNNYHNDN